jgi:hypothetical protein
MEWLEVDDIEVQADAGGLKTFSWSDVRSWYQPHRHLLVLVGEPHSISQYLTVDFCIMLEFPL